MFCSKCACELPTTANFCVRCGEPVWRPSVSEEVSSAYPERGAVREISAVPQLVNSEGDKGVIESVPTQLSSLTTDTTINVHRITYAAFASQILACSLACSVFAFELAIGAAPGVHKLTVLSVAAVVAILLFGFSVRSWRGLKATDDASNVNYRRKLAYLGGIFAVLFLLAAALSGRAIGKSGSEAAQLASDFDTMSNLGDRISNARGAVDRTIESHLKMYKNIEGDVNDFDVVLHRLRMEMSVYDDKFPAHHATTMKSIHSIELGIKRADLLKKQIVVSSEIELLNPNIRWDAWQLQMQPLLDEENALDNQ
jgi:hypothetical protein